MAEFVAFEPGIEVNGEAILSVIDGSTIKGVAIALLARHGIIQPRPGQWYSQQAWLNCFKEIHASIGPNTCFLIGRKIPENAVFPADIDNIEKALSSIDVAYHLNHRKNGTILFDAQSGQMHEGIGHYGYERIPGRKQAHMICNNPYPCDFDRGIIDTMARKFKPNGTLFTKVTHDDTAPCRKLGADACTYLIEW